MATLLGTDRRVLTLALARMADSVGNSFLIVVLPAYIASGVVTGEFFGFGVTVVTGIVLSLFGFVSSATQPVAGRLSDRSGRRKVFILVGLLILAVSSAAYAFATSYRALVVIRIFQGLGVALTIPCTVALVNELSTTRTRGNSMGVFNTFRLLGFGVGPLVAGVLVDRGPYVLSVGGWTLGLSGFDAAFALAATTALLSYVLVWALISDPERTTAAAGDDIDLAVRSRDDSHLLDPVFTLGLATLFMAVGIALFATLEEIINHRLDQGTAWFGLQFGAFILAQVGLQVPIGRASDAWGRRPFILAGLVLLAPATLVQGFVFTSVGMLVARIVQGVAAAMVFAPALALAGDVAKEGQSGSTLSVLTMAFGLGTAIGPLSSGFLVALGFQVPFAFGAALAVVGLVLVFTQVEETVTQADSPAAVPQD